MAHKGKATPPTTTVVPLIEKSSQSYDVKLSELVGSFLESGWSNTALNKSSGAAGAFQIMPGNLPRVDAENPVKALAWARSRYAAAVKEVGAAAFRANPEAAAQKAAVIAERPTLLTVDFATYYSRAEGQGKVDTAFSLSTKALAGSGSKVPATPAVNTKPLLAKPATVSAAGKYAAQQLKKAGLSGDQLIVALATLGAQTNGRYTRLTLRNFIDHYTATGGVPDTKLLNSNYGKVEQYIGQAQANLHAIGVHAKYTGNPDAGQGQTGIADEGAGVGDSLTHEVSAAGQSIAGTLDSWGSVFTWFSKPNNLIRVGLIVGGFILIIIGLAKVTGAASVAERVATP